MVNIDQKEWVPTFFFENPSLSSQKEIVPDLRDLVVIWEVIYVLLFSTQTVLTGVSCVVPGYGSSLMMISAQMRNG